MSRRSTPACVLAVLLLFVALDAKAISFSMDPAGSVVGIGQSVDIDLNVSGLGDFAPDSLGVYDIDVAWDPNIITLNTVSFGSDLSILFPSVQTVTPGAGTVNLFELSLDFPSDLDTFQPGSFTIATLTFEVIDFGTSAVTPTVNVVGDADGLPLQLESVTGATVSAIPEPTSAVLWMAGLLVVHRRLRRGHRA